MKWSQAARLGGERDAQVEVLPGRRIEPQCFVEESCQRSVDAIHPVKPGETHCPRGTTCSNPSILGDPQIRKTSAESTFSYRTLLVTGFQFPPPPPKFSRKFGPFSQNPQEESGFFANRDLPQALCPRRNQRPEEVLADISAVPLFDHLHGRSAVFRKPFKLAPSESAHAMNVCRVI